MGDWDGVLLRERRPLLLFLPLEERLSFLSLGVPLPLPSSLSNDFECFRIDLKMPRALPPPGGELPPSGEEGPSSSCLFFFLPPERWGLPDGGSAADVSFKAGVDGPPEGEGCMAPKAGELRQSRQSERAGLPEPSLSDLLSLRSLLVLLSLR